LISTSMLSEPNPARSASKLLPSLGIILVTGGLFLLGWFTYLWFQPEPPPYRYHLVEEGGVEKFQNLDLQAFPDLSIGKFEIRVDNIDKPLAAVYRATRGGATPILLHVENQFPEPIAAMEVMLSETTALSAAISKHVPKDAIILAWWDTSKRIALLSERQVMFNSHVGQPVVAPTYWKDRYQSIGSYEEEFWGTPASAEDKKKFEQFADALIAFPNKGASQLRDLVGSREAYAVVHVSDIYKLGLMRPERIDVAFKDFPLTGNVHGLTNQVKAWLTDNKYTSYTLQSLSEKIVRAYFLREGGSSNILLAKMLPFSNARPLDLEALQLVHKEGGYWIYKIPSADRAKGES